MELSDFARAVGRRWWIILAALVAGIAVSLGSIAVTQPVYQSSVGFFVVAPTADRLSALEADNLVRARITSYASLVTSDRFLEQIVAATGDGLTKAEAAKAISAFGDPTTLLLKVEVNDVNAARSLAMASAIGTHFGAMVNDLEGRSKTANSETVLNVVSGPTLASTPVQPRKVFNLGLGVLLGLAVGLGLVVALERADRSIRKEAQLGAAMTVLATMPKDKVARKPELMMIPHSNSVLDEAARRLRTSIQFHPRARELQILAITASQTADGATTTALILAKAFSESDRKVLLVEANLRTPECAAHLGMASAPGLTDVLAGTCEVGAAIQKTANHNLDMLVSGNHTDRPAELLGGGIGDLLGELRKLYEVIVIDTAALATWTDTALVAAAADGTILVARHGRTTPARIDAALVSLSSVHANVLGAVLNVNPIRRSQGHEVLTGSNFTEGSQRVGVGSRSDKAAATAARTSEAAAAHAVSVEKRRKSGTKI